MNVETGNYSGFMSVCAKEFCKQDIKKPGRGSGSRQGCHFRCLSATQRQHREKQVNLIFRLLETRPWQVARN
jgi:hypothetical protein